MEEDATLDRMQGYPLLHVIEIALAVGHGVSLPRPRVSSDELRR